MKTPDEIKKGLNCNNIDHCNECPYDGLDCAKHVDQDALAYIQQLESRLAQLERERDALEERIHGECSVCVNGKTAMCNDCIHNEWAWHPKHDYWELDGACKEKEEEE